MAFWYEASPEIGAVCSLLLRERGYDSLLRFWQDKTPNHLSFIDNNGPTYPAIMRDCKPISLSEQQISLLDKDHFTHIIVDTILERPISPSLDAILHDYEKEITILLIQELIYFFNARPNFSQMSELIVWSESFFVQYKQYFSEQDLENIKVIRQDTYGNDHTEIDFFVVAHHCTGSASFLYYLHKMGIGCTTGGQIDYDNDRLTCALDRISEQRKSYKKVGFLLDSPLKNMWSVRKLSTYNVPTLCLVRDQVETILSGANGHLYLLIAMSMANLKNVLGFPNVSTTVHDRFDSKHLFFYISSRIKNIINPSDVKIIDEKDIRKDKVLETMKSVSEFLSIDRESVGDYIFMNFNTPENRSSYYTDIEYGTRDGHIFRTSKSSDTEYFYQIFSFFNALTPDKWTIVRSISHNNESYDLLCKDNGQKVDINQFQTMVGDERIIHMVEKKNILIKRILYLYQKNKFDIESVLNTITTDEDLLNQFRIASLMELDELERLSPGHLDRWVYTRRFMES